MRWANIKLPMWTGSFIATSGSGRMRHFMYMGVLLMYCNPLTAAFTLFAMVMLHLQILQEERYLTGTFGAAYQEYMAQVYRYLGRKPRR